jgi:hypothetical protein
VIKGTIQGDDFTSIKWTLTGEAAPGFPIPDFPLVVTVSRHQIHWKEPEITFIGRGWGWDGTSIRDTLLTK